MGRRGPPPMDPELRALRRRGPGKKTLANSATASFAGQTYVIGGKLNADQAQLLADLPDWLGETEAAEYAEIVQGAPWLRPIDRTCVVVLAGAAVRHRTAATVLAEAMRDSAGMAAPGSDTAKRAAAYGKIMKQTQPVIDASVKLLGASPKARTAIGIVLAP